MEVIQAYDTIPSPQVIIALPAVLPPSLVLSQSSIFDSQDFFPSKEISPKDTETPIESLIPLFLVFGLDSSAASIFWPMYTSSGVNTLGMKRGFLSQKRSEVGRGVKEKQVYRIHSLACNEENMNDAGTTVGPTLVGNSPGKRVAYAFVTDYVKNTWGKYGLVKSMLNSSTGIFTFQFSSMESLDMMLENGNVSVWVKHHGVRVTAFSEDGLSAIATKIDTPLMLDSYTSNMEGFYGEDEVASVDNDTNFLASKDLLWIFLTRFKICDNLDIKVRGRKKN
nr:hypothetical protein [Tanacetum cinerariifolium]